MLCWPMTQQELAALITPVRTRHNRRVSILLAAFLTAFFGGFAILDSFGLSRGDRRNYGRFITVAVLVIFVAGFQRVIARLKPDCEALGAICPSCRKPLYSFRGQPRDLRGRCPHCAYHLIDSERVKAGGT
jgi:hypothetical protein